MTASNAEKIFQIMHRLKKTTVISEMVGGVDMSHGEFMMLRLIRFHAYDKESMTISELSELSKVSKSAVSQMINALEDKGYVERLTTKDDRRIVHVKLTEEGVHNIEKAFCAFLKVINDILDKMGKEDAENLIKLLNKLYLIADNYKLNNQV